MTEQNLVEISRLSYAAFHAREKYHAMLMINRPYDFDEREQISIRINLAFLEMIQANRLLEGALIPQQNGKVK